MRVHKSIDESKIYALIDPRTDKVRYVGQTTRLLEERLKGHYADMRSSSGNGRKNKWIKELLDNDIEPKLKHLETVDIHQSHLHEDEWIKYFCNKGCDLFNNLDLIGTGQVSYYEGGKGSYTFCLEKAVERELNRVAGKIYRSKSSIVQEAIQKWLKQYEETHN